MATWLHEAVLSGMGLVVLHSGHMSKVFRRLMGTSCGLCWREVAEREERDDRGFGDRGGDVHVRDLARCLGARFRVDDQPRRLIISILCGNELVNIAAAANMTGILVSLYGAERAGWISILVMVPLLLLGVVALAWAGMAWGWRRRAGRQSDLGRQSGGATGSRPPGTTGTGGSGLY